MARQFSFGETKVCNMHLHVLFCRRRFALLFLNPTSASLAMPHVWVATVTLLCLLYHMIRTKFGICGEIKQDIWICLHKWYIASLSHYSWPRGPNSHTIRAKNQGIQNILVTSSIRVSRYFLHNENADGHQHLWYLNLLYGFDVYAKFIVKIKFSIIFLCSILYSINHGIPYISFPFFHFKLR